MNLSFEDSMARARQMRDFIAGRNCYGSTWWFFHHRQPHASNCIAVRISVSAWTSGRFVFLFLQADVYYTS